MIYKKWSKANLTFIDYYKFWLDLFPQCGTNCCVCCLGSGEQVGQWAEAGNWHSEARVPGVGG